MPEETSALFELQLPLPDSRLASIATRLVGFPARYAQIRRELLLLLDQDGLAKWSDTHYGARVAVLETVFDRYPLLIFHGDVGTGKTATAESAANAIAGELQKQAMLFKLSTRVRGGGNVGEMSFLINQAFEAVTKVAEQSKLSFLIIDEADFLASSRNAAHSHHEDKVAVNTLIQKINDARRFNGNVLVILCTNRYSVLDPAIIRRAAYIEEFRRPNDAERRALFTLDCEGLGFSPAVIEEFVLLTGPLGPYKRCYSYSDIRTRLLPDALAQAYPNRKMCREDFHAAVSKIVPSPTIDKLDRQFSAT